MENSQKIDADVGDIGSEKKTEHGIVRSGVELLDCIGDDYVFVGSNSIRDKIKKLGIEAYKVISAGGPVSTDDLKELNPKIPDRALEGYQKKLDSLFAKLKDLIDNGEKLIFAMALNEETDQMIDKRIEEIEKFIGGKFKRVSLLSWDDI